MRVVGAGWGRTATTSLAAGLDRLGLGPCLQMQEMWTHPDLADAWNRHHAGEPIDWAALLDGWQSTVDWPGCWQWADFARLWPESIVVLSVRDSGSWCDSVLGSIHSWTAPGKDAGPPSVAALLARLWDVEFGSWEAFLDRDHAIACFERHNQQVRDTCPPDRLLEWSVTDGWRPLCQALGLDEPEEPFPHLNRR